MVYKIIISMVVSRNMKKIHTTVATALLLLPAEITCLSDWMSKQLHSSKCSVGTATLYW